jgi:hypothetical protein
VETCFRICSFKLQSYAVSAVCICLDTAPCGSAVAQDRLIMCMTD